MGLYGTGSPSAHAGAALSAGVLADCEIRSASLATDISMAASVTCTASASPAAVLATRTVLAVSVGGVSAATVALTAGIRPTGTAAVVASTGPPVLTTTNKCSAAVAAQSGTMAGLTT